MGDRTKKKKLFCFYTLTVIKGIIKQKRKGIETKVITGKETEMAE